MDTSIFLLLSACAVILVLLLGWWLRLYRRNRQLRSQFGKTTVHESTLKKSRRSRSAR